MNGIMLSMNLMPPDLQLQKLSKDQLQELVVQMSSEFSFALKDSESKLDDAHKQLFDTQAQLQTTVVELQTAKEQQQRDAQLIHFKEVTIQKLTFELSVLRRRSFFKKHEHFTAEQGLLFDEFLNADLGEVQSELRTITPETKKTTEALNRPRRQPLPTDLARVEIRHEPGSTVCSCGCQLNRIGEDVSEKLDYQPGIFSVQRHIRGKWACKHCQTLIQAPVPAHIIDKGIPTTGLLAQVLVNKYSDHLPLYRQEQIFARSGYAIAQSTLAQWVGQCGAALQPLVQALRAILLSESVLHADETPVKVLGAQKGGSKNAYLWVYASTQTSAIKAVVYDFAESRSGRHAQHFLENWQGTLVCDDYAGYKRLIGNNRICEAGCMAHARRKFFELHVANKSLIAEEALKRFAVLYEIEDSIKTADMQTRQNIRESKAKPIMQGFYQWLLEKRAMLPSGTGIIKAIDYSLRRWQTLTHYLSDPRTPIDNNWAENQIRPIALGRKNWLFAGSLRSGQRAAAIMSLLQSAKINGLDPYAYLKDVMEKLPTHPYSKIEELLPHRWQPANTITV